MRSITTRCGIRLGSSWCCARNFAPAGWIFCSMLGSYGDFALCWLPTAPVVLCGATRRHSQASREMWSSPVSTICLGRALCVSLSPLSRKVSVCCGVHRNVCKHATVVKSPGISLEDPSSCGIQGKTSFIRPGPGIEVFMARHRRFSRDVLTNR